MTLLHWLAEVTKYAADSTLSLDHTARQYTQHTQNINETKQTANQKLLRAHRHTLSARSLTGSDDHDRYRASDAAVCRRDPCHLAPCTWAAWPSHRQERAHLPATPAGTGVSGSPTAATHNLHSTYETSDHPQH